MKYLAYLLIIIFFCLSGFALLTAISCYRTTFGIDVTDRSLAGQLARMQIPVSATNFHCRTMKGIDRVTYGRFDIPANDLKQILSQMPADGKQGEFSGYSHVTIHETKEIWWQPGQLQNRKIIEWSQPGFSVNLLYGDNGPNESLTIYFFNFEL